MSKVLVIGGKGYIGSALSTSLAAAGCAVQSWDTCWFGDHTSTDNVSADYGAIRADDSRIKRLGRGHKPGVILAHSA